MTLAPLKTVVAPDPDPDAPAPAKLPRIDRVDRPNRRRSVSALARFLLGLLAVAFAAVIVLEVQDRIVGALVHEQRQQRLAADFQTPAPERTVRRGEPIAVIQAVDIGLNEIVVEGDSVSHLRGGPARRTASALPGEPGRTVILGHGSAFGGPFAAIDELEPGDVVAVQTRNNGPIVAYIVRDVMPNADADEIPDPDEGIAQLVLVSSSGRWFGAEPIVVVASALPVIESPPRVDPVVFDAHDRGVPFGREALVANLAVLAIALAWFGLHGRYRQAVVAAVIAPMVVFAIVSYLLALDSVLASTR